MLLKLIRSLLDLCVPLVGASVGVILLKRSIAEQYPKIGIAAALHPTKGTLFGVAVFIASLLYLQSINEHRFPSRVVASQSPIVALSRNVRILQSVAACLLLTSLYALLLDALGLVQGDVYTDLEALALKLVILILSASAIMKAAPYLQSLPVHLLNGIVITSRDVHFSLQEALLGGLSASTPVNVTSFERYTRHYVRESKICARWMTNWQTRVKKKEIAVRQILRVYNEKNLVEDVRDRLDRFREHSGYQIRLLISPPELPILDVYIEHGRYAVLCFPSETSQPFMVQQYVYVSGQAILLALEQWFASMWHHGLPVNDSTSSPELISSVRASLNELSRIDPGLLERPGEIVWEAARASPEVVRLLVEVAKRTALADFRGRSDHVHQAILAAIAAVESTSPVTHHRSAFTVIREVSECAQKSLRSTAVLSAKDDYWPKHLGEMVALQESLSRRGVEVQRVFVATSRDLLEAYRSTIQKITDSGCDVRVLVDSHARVSDFLIVDDTTLVQDNGSSAIESTRPEDVKTMATVFGRTWEAAVPWSPEKEQ